MNLTAMIAWLKELAKQPGMTDAVATRYLRLGQDYLDSLQRTPQTLCEYETTIAAGAYTISLGGSAIYGVQRVWRQDAVSDTGWVLMDHYDTVHELRDLYPEWADCDANTPQAWSVGYTRTPNQTELTTASIVTLVTMPPADIETTVRIEGDFSAYKFPETGGVGTEVTWWSSERPGILALAALMQIDLIQHRNAQRAQETRVMLEDQMRAVDMLLQRQGQASDKARR